VNLKNTEAFAIYFRRKRARFDVIFTHKNQPPKKHLARKSQTHTSDFCGFSQGRFVLLIIF